MEKSKNLKKFLLKNNIFFKLYFNKNLKVFNFLKNKKRKNNLRFKSLFTIFYKQKIFLFKYMYIQKFFKYF
jgi:hypothetical protein